MNNIHFHPHIPMIEANRIARAQGGQLVWHNDMFRIRVAQQHVEQAGADIQAGNYEQALGHIRTARAQVEEVAHA